MRRILCFAAGAMLLASAGVSAAQQLTLGTTANPAPAAIFLADQKGLFKKHGVDLTVQLVTGDPTIPAALISDSIQIASVTPTTFLNAVANGIDLVAFSGTTITTHGSKDIAIVAGKDSGIKTPADFAGKTLGVAGIGAVLDVMLKNWLDQNGVDVSTAKFIEMTLPSMADQLKAGRVDALITVDQFAQRMISEGFGILIANPLAEIPEGQSAQEIVATRAWADANPETIAKVRAAIKEAEGIAKADPEAIRAALGNAMNLPPPVTARIALPVVDTSLSVAQLDWWLAIMKKHGLVKGDVNTASLVLP
nr:ABC transporter substrate-binding protein [Mesorhizobium sp.]